MVKTMSYVHKVQYYETDKMGITHHSNYIRWMEEARSEFLREIGWGYERLEAMGVISPVTSISCDYKKTTTYADDVTIDVRIKDFNGIRLVVGYEMRNVEGKLVFSGTSEHCFLSASGKILRVDREYPNLYKAFSDLSCKESL